MGVVRSILNPAGALTGLRPSGGGSPASQGLAAAPVEPGAEPDIGARRVADRGSDRGRLSSDDQRLGAAPVRRRTARLLGQTGV
jgi:hypothetical protein